MVDRPSLRCFPLIKKINLGFDIVVEKPGKYVVDGGVACNVGFLVKLKAKHLSH